MRLEPLEEQITECICNYLAYQSGELRRICPSGFLKNGKMRKHVSKYVRKGMSDIQFMSKGTMFLFEVKTKKEHIYVTKHYGKIKKGTAFNLNKKQMHIKDQIDYLESMIKNGAAGGFVSSVEHVKEIIRTKVGLIDKGCC